MTQLACSRKFEQESRRCAIAMQLPSASRKISYRHGLGLTYLTYHALDANGQMGRGLIVATSTVLRFGLNAAEVAELAGCLNIPQYATCAWAAPLPGVMPLDSRL
jgi:hypothetical protein